MVPWKEKLVFNFGVPIYYFLLLESDKLKVSAVPAWNASALYPLLLGDPCIICTVHQHQDIEIPFLLSEPEFMILSLNMFTMYYECTLENIPAKNLNNAIYQKYFLWRPWDQQTFVFTAYVYLKIALVL